LDDRFGAGEGAQVIDSFTAVRAIGDVFLDFGGAAGWEFAGSKEDEFLLIGFRVEGSAEDRGGGCGLRDSVAARLAGINVLANPQDFGRLELPCPVACDFIRREVRFHTIPYNVS
jgi:hypothetical protein